MGKIVIDEATAKVEFLRFTEAMMLEVDVDSLNGEELEEYTAAQEKIITGLMTGKCSVNGEGEISVNAVFEGGEEQTLTFKKPTGRVLLAKSKIAKQQLNEIERMFHIMGAMVSISPTKVSSMDLYDVKLCMAITTLFLA